ncbi:MAG: hypothetical protein J7L54_05910 [Elusimicrobia bacterium]|nr:hypothetical protein [Elusimicrobiota bacterium]
MKNERWKMKSEKVEKGKSRKGKRTPYLISPLEGGRKRGGIFPYQLVNLSTCHFIILDFGLSF